MGGYPFSCVVIKIGKNLKSIGSGPELISTIDHIFWTVIEMCLSEIFDLHSSWFQFSLTQILQKKFVHSKTENKYPGKASANEWPLLNQYPCTDPKRKGHATSNFPLFLCLKICFQKRLTNNL